MTRPLQNTWRYAILALMVFMVAAPIYWMLTISFKTSRDIYRLPSLFPTAPTLDNYRVLLVDKHFLVNIGNSLIVAGAVTFVSVIASSLAAYSLVRYKYPVRRGLGRMILLAYLTPTSLLFVPLSIIVANLNLGNSLHGLVAVYLAFSVPFCTWLLMGYFRGIPPDLEEQAMVDGTTRLGAFARVLIPLSAPGLVATAIFTFAGAWNELLLALIFITSEGTRTVPLALQYLITGDVFLWGPIMAGAVFSALPVMILYFLAQRFVVQGLTGGSIKG